MILSPKANGQNNLTVAPLDADRIDAWMDANIATRGIGELRRLSAFRSDAQQGSRMIFCAWRDDVFLGHVTLQNYSEYPAFRRHHIPEIVDLWVQPDARNKAVGHTLLTFVCNHAKEKGAQSIGLAVGVTQDFGAAHRLYNAFGFRPDGTGLWAQGKNMARGDVVTLDDDAVLIWVKSLA